jgi:hypothetical protein
MSVEPAHVALFDRPEIFEIEMRQNIEVAALGSYLMQCGALHEILR